MDILVYLDEDQAAESRCLAALEVVRVCGGHIHCLQVSSPTALLATGSFGTARMLAERAGDVERHKEALETAARARFGAAGVSWDYRRFDGDVAQTIVEQSRLVDLVVLNNERQSSPLNSFTPSAAEVLPRMRVPVLAVPAHRPTPEPEQAESGKAESGKTGGFSPAGCALIAWDGSAECAHALRSALVMLKCASEVVLVTVEGERFGIPAAQASAYLSRHGIRAEAYRLPRHDRSITGALLEAVRVHRAAYVAMGAFGNGRAREYLLGGVTRDMLKSCPVPLVLAH